MKMQRQWKVVFAVMLAIVIGSLPVAAILRAEGTAKPMLSHDFTDVPVVGQEFMEPYIDAFYHQGITGGCSVSPLQYCPTNPVTRGSMAVFVGRALGYVEAANLGYVTRAYFNQTDTAINAMGVAGFAPNGWGVFGSSVAGNGVAGHSSTSYGVAASSDFGSALFAQTGSEGSNDGIYDIALGGVSGELWGSTLHLFSNNDVLVDLDNANATAGAFNIRNGTNVNVFTVDEDGGTIMNGDIEVGGNDFFTPGSLDIEIDNNSDGTDVFRVLNGGNGVILQVTEAGVLSAPSLQISGAKSAIVDTVSYGTRAMYAVESPENWFEDFGSAELVGGEAVITIDPMFAETVNLDEQYQVYLTPVGGWAELYIADQSATSFTVRATDATSDLEFYYRIIAKRLGFEDMRMEEVED